MSLSERFHVPRFSRFNNINIMSRSRLSYTRMDNAPQHDKIVGSVNGLVCLVTGLGKTVSAPQSCCRNSTLSEIFRGFSWDNLENEYKVFLCYKEQKSWQGIIYGSNSDSWNKLVVPDTFVGKCFMPNPDVIVKGCPYWTAPVADMVSLYLSLRVEITSLRSLCCLIKLLVKSVILLLM